METMKILFGFPFSPDGDVIGELKKAFGEKGFEAEITATYAKTGMDAGAVSGTFDGAIVLKDLQVSKPYQAAELIALKERLGNTPLVVVCDDTLKGSDFVNSLLLGSVFDVVFASDSTFDEIRDRILHPRTRKEARLYYGITGNDYDERNSAGDFEYINFLTTDSSVPLPERFLYIKKLMGDETFERFLYRLPMNLKKEAMEIDELADFFEIEKPKKKSFFKGLFNKKKDKREEIPREEETEEPSPVITETKPLVKEPVKTEVKQFVPELEDDAFSFDLEGDLVESPKKETIKLELTDEVFETEEVFEPETETKQEQVFEEKVKEEKEPEEEKKIPGNNREKGFSQTVISVMALRPCIGCSFMSRLLANYYCKAEKKKVALVTLNKLTVSGSRNLLKGVTEYTESGIAEAFEDNDVIIFDMGTEYRKFKNDYERSTYRVLTCIPEDDYFKLLYAFIKEQKAPLKWIYAFNHVVNRKKETEVADLMEDYVWFSVPGLTEDDPGKEMLKKIGAVLKAGRKWKRG